MHLGLGPWVVTFLPDCLSSPDHIGNVDIDCRPNDTSFLRVPPSSAGGNGWEFHSHGMQGTATYVARASAHPEAQRRTLPPRCPAYNNDAMCRDTTEELPVLELSRRLCSEY